MCPLWRLCELRPGIDGLVHISEMSYAKRVLDPHDIVHPGQTVSVLVKEVDLDKHRIGLSIKDAEGDPWLEVNDQFSQGQTVNGTVEKQEKFGFFITLAPGIVGLLPKSVMSRSSQAASLNKLKSGDTVTVTIDAIKAGERKISLGLGDSDDESNWQNYSDKKASSDSSLGSLGDKLAEALKKKN